jgi:hypothetical protein
VILVLELNRQVRDLYVAYKKKHLQPETALAIVSGFVLDLINEFGDQLNDATPVKEEWQPFAPFEFVLDLNNTLKEFKEVGLKGLKAEQQRLLTNSNALLGAAIRASLKSHPDSFPGEDHFQIPHAVARELLLLSD